MKNLKSDGIESVSNDPLLSFSSSNFSTFNEWNYRRPTSPLYTPYTERPEQRGQLTDSTPALRKTSKSLFLKQVLEVIKSNLHVESFSVNDLGRILSLSKMQVYRRVKKATGKPPVKLIRSVRLEKAKQLMLNSEFSISEISYQVGFADPNYFSRVFTKEFGNSPRKERNLLQRASQKVTF